jgi:hypothetical protein
MLHKSSPRPPLNDLFATARLVVGGAMLCCQQSPHHACKWLLLTILLFAQALAAFPAHLLQQLEPLVARIQGCFGIAAWCIIALWVVCDGFILQVLIYLRSSPPAVTSAALL